MVSPFIMRPFRSGVVTDLERSYVEMRVETKKNKQGLHHKLEKFSDRLWFNIIIWCHPKMVIPGRAASLSDATWGGGTMPTITFFYHNVIKETALFCCTL